MIKCNPTNKKFAIEDYGGKSAAMEFHEKLQELRKKRGLTQEELAQVLYVSRTAISKWESGRGYPGIESLKAIAAFFSVTIDELLSGEELLNAAEEEQRDRKNYLCDLVFGLLDLGVAVLLFLPLFGQRADGITWAVPLLALTETASYLKTIYIVFVGGSMVAGSLMLALQNCHHAGWVRKKRGASVLLSVLGVLLFVMSRQPYAAVVLFLFLVVKVLIVFQSK